jgi:hypothetical protein
VRSKWMAEVRLRIRNLPESVRFEKKYQNEQFW